MNLLPTVVLAASESSASSSVGYGALFMLVLFILGSVWIGVIANRVTQKGSFMKGFFLGNRGLGAWALALTATVQSGGTFMGFPSLVYTHGWIVALWIGSYMVVPITGFGVLGKRLARYTEADVRELLERPYRLIYRVLADRIEIVTVMHYRQLMPSDVAHLNDRS